MRLTGPEASIVAVMVGAIIGFVPNYLMDVRRERSLLRSRWDSGLFDLCSDFASAARGLQVLCLRRAVSGVQKTRFWRRVGRRSTKPIHLASFDRPVCAE
jgi:hypothetical protein